MISAINSLNTALPFLYFFLFFSYGYEFISEEKKFRKANRIYLIIVLITHFFYIITRTIEFNHPPITAKAEIFTIIAFSVSLSYLLLEIFSKISGTGVFIIFISFLFQVFSSLFIENLLEVPEILRNKLLGAHVISAMLGYSGFTISAVYGILYLLLYKEIKISNFGLIFNRLPNLETLERLSFISAVIGFFLLTMAIVIGLFWLPWAFPDFSIWDPKLLVSLFGWIIYGYVILAKWFNDLPGKKLVLYLISGFFFLIISMILSSFFTKSFHYFG